MHNYIFKTYINGGRDQLFKVPKITVDISASTD